jgi:hypothetical protein
MEIAEKAFLEAIPRPPISAAEANDARKCLRINRVTRQVIGEDAMFGESYRSAE